MVVSSIAYGSSVRVKKKDTCTRCGRTKADERKDPGRCWRAKRHVWGAWTGKTVKIAPSGFPPEQEEA